MTVISNTSTNLVVTSSDASRVVITNPNQSIVKIGGQQGPPGVAGSFAFPGLFISLVWGSVSSESANKIELLAQCYDINDNAFSSGVVCVELLVSDGAAIHEPSDTATFALPASLVGSCVSGIGTGRSAWVTNSSGQFKVAISDTTAGSRYIWTKAGGHEQVYVRARDGIQQITFS